MFRMFRKYSYLLLYRPLKETENVYSSYCDLTYLTLEDPELKMFMDGKSFINQRQQGAGCSGDP